MEQDDKGNLIRVGFGLLYIITVLYFMDLL